MPILYTNNPDADTTKYSVRNPQYFVRVESTDAVIVEGDYPEIVKAYADAGIHAPKVEKPKAEAKASKATVSADKE